MDVLKVIPNNKGNSIMIELLILLFYDYPFALFIINLVMY